MIRNWTNITTYITYDREIDHFCTYTVAGSNMCAGEYRCIKAEPKWSILCYIIWSGNLKAPLKMSSYQNFSRVVDFRVLTLRSDKNTNLTATWAKFFPFFRKFPRQNYILNDHEGVGSFPKSLLKTSYEKSLRKAKWKQKEQRPIRGFQEGKWGQYSPELIICPPKFMPEPVKCEQSSATIISKRSSSVSTSPTV